MQLREAAEAIKQLRTHLARYWEQIMGQVENIRKLNDEILREGRNLSPVLHIPTFCLGEREIKWAAVFLSVSPEVLRREFSYLWSRMAAQVCGEPCSCGHPRLPLGYIFSAPASTTGPDGREEDVNVILVNTVFGRKALAVAKVSEGKLGDLEWMEEGRISGNFVIPLPRLEELEETLRREVEADEKMYW